MTPTSSGDLGQTAHRLVCGAVLLVGLAIAGPAGAPHGAWTVEVTSARAAASTGSGQSAIQRRVQEYLVTFEVTESPEKAAASVDQITIFFSNRQLDTRSAPTLAFAEDILEEFSFSALDVAGGRLRFSRRVRDKSFLEARYIRIVNHGFDPWGGATLTMAVDGEPVLDRVKLTNRKGGTGTGILDWNRKSWARRTYWEGELQVLAERRMAK